MHILKTIKGWVWGAAKHCFIYVQSIWCAVQLSDKNIGIQLRDNAKKQQAVFVYPVSPPSKNALTLCPAVLCLQPQPAKFIPAAGVFTKLVLFILLPHPAPISISQWDFTSYAFCSVSFAYLVSDVVKTKVVIQRLAWEVHLSTDGRSRVVLAGQMCLHEHTISAVFY